jgi:peptide-methionine (S)-S-oxide reductase
MYGLRRTDFNDGRSTKVYAEELGRTDFISFNYYRTASAEYLKPCEMPEEKVLDFLRGFSEAEQDGG